MSTRWEPFVSFWQSFLPLGYLHSALLLLILNALSRELFRTFVSHWVSQLLGDPVFCGKVVLRFGTGPCLVQVQWNSFFIRNNEVKLFYSKVKVQAKLSFKGMSLEFLLLLLGAPVSRAPGIASVWSCLAVCQRYWQGSCHWRLLGEFETPCGLMPLYSTITHKTRIHTWLMRFHSFCDSLSAEIEERDRAEPDCGGNVDGADERQG